jgi:GTP-binding protein HflX
MTEEKAILVGVSIKGEPESRVYEYLDELEFLAETAGAITIKKYTQKLDYPNPRTYVGTGKIAEIFEFIDTNEIELAIFDDDLSPSQMRNISEVLKIKVLDRTNLILDIFAKRAQTAIAKAQVELAQLQYILPRLTGMWTHLERQRGGIGMRGPGEKEIETDRRIIKDKITRLKEELQRFDKQKNLQRKNRGKLVRVSLIGYTNVGKSTLMNMLTKADVFAENKLFATLDTTVRKFAIKNLPFLITDTVGFIRKLPHHLVEAFKSTLDEVRESDLLMHIVDISHPQFEEQIEVVEKTLNELDSSSKPTIIVFNKIDNYTYTPQEKYDLTPKLKINYSLEDLKQMWIANQNKKSVFISAKNKTNVEELRELMYSEIKQIHTARFPFDDLFYPDFDENEILDEEL